jgi:hypothetical protein
MGPMEQSSPPNPETIQPQIMKPFPFIPVSADRLPAPSAQHLGVTAICLVALALGTTLQASGTIDVPNGGFDTATGNQADYWSTSGNPPGALPGDMRGGSDGGYGWTADYFAGDQPTGKTFASTVNGPVRQDLTTTFEAGTEYTLSMQIFSAGNYGPSQDGAIL